MNGFISSPFPPTSARALYQGTTLVVPHISSQRWALAPVPISSTFCSLGEWNERVDIEPLPTHERSCFVSGHDFSRAAHQPSTMGFSPCSYYEHILFIRRSRLDLCQIKGGCSLGTLSLSNGPALSAPLSFLSSRGADLPAASQEWNERVDIEPFPPTSARALYQGTTLVVPHTSPQRWALAPVPISSTFCSLGAYPDFLPHRPHQRPLMWFSLKRTTCSRPKPQVSTGNPGKPRDLQFRGRLLETRNTKIKQNCHLVPGI